MLNNSTSSHPLLKKNRIWFKRISYCLLGLSLFLAIFLSAFIFYIGTESGLKNTIVLVNRLGGKHFHIAEAEGKLWKDVSFQGISFETDQVKVNIDSLRLNWQAKALWKGKLDIQRLALGHLHIQWKSAWDEVPKPTVAPKSLRLPFQINAPLITLSHLSVNEAQKVLNDATLMFKSNKQQYQLLIQRAATSVGSIQGQAQVFTAAPFISNAHLALKENTVKKRVVVDLAATGNLRQLHIVGSTKEIIANGNIDVWLDVFAPYEYQILQRGKIRIKDFNPRSIVPDTYDADLAIYADVKAQHQKPTTGHLLIENKNPLTFDLDGLPLKALRVDWQAVNNHLAIPVFELLFKEKGRLSGKGMLRPEDFTLALKADNVNPAALWSSAMHSSLKGEVVLGGGYAIPEIVASLKEEAKQLSLSLKTGWRTSEEEHVFLLRELLLNHGIGSLKIQGELDFLNKKSFMLKADLTKFNPAKFGRYPSGNLNATLHAHGFLLPTLHIDGDYVFHPSQFNGAELKGKGELSWVDRELQHIDSSLILGKNTLKAQGKYRGVAKDKLKVDINFPDLAQMGAGFTGKLIGKGSIEGAGKNVMVQGNLEALSLKLPGNIAIRRLNLMGNIEPDIHRPLIVNLKGEGVNIGGLEVDNAVLDIRGTQANHTLSMDGKGKWQTYPLLINAKLVGHFLADTHTWQSTIQAFKLGFAEGITQLQSPAQLEIGKDRIRIENALLKSVNSHVALDLFAMDAHGKIDTHGRINHLNIADVLAWSPQETLKSDLVIKGGWQLKADEDINGKIELKRQSGDLIWINPASKQSLHSSLSDFTVQALIKAGRVHIESNLASSLGVLKTTVSTTLSRQNEKWGIYSGSDLNARVVGSIPKLEAISPFFNPRTKLGGRVNIDLSRTGKIGRGILSGNVQGNALTIQDISSGVTLNNGIINARLSPDYLTLDQCSFTGGAGTLHAQGKIGLNDRHANIQIKAEKLTAVSRPDILAILSGQGTMSMKDGALTIEGKVYIDEAKINFATDTPALSDDVVIVEDETSPKVKPENFVLTNLLLDVDLGKKTSYSGYGLNAQLRGALHMTAQSEQPLYAAGVVRIEKGSYKAYGQNLTIERGLISFNGPLDNPGLDILAVRKGLTVEPGVQLFGPAINPRLTLISDPPVPDNEKLSWLMFGKSTDALNPQDGASVLMAASAALIGGNGPSLQQKIADTVGLDEIDFQSRTAAYTNTTTTYLTLGKRLAKNLYISYEQSLGEVDSALKLQYILSRRWQAVARAGNKETTFDLSYTLSFD